MTITKRTGSAPATGNPSGSAPATESTTPTGNPSGSPAGSPSGSTPAAPKVPHLRKVSEFAEKWTGKSPQDLLPNVKREDITRYTDKDILDTDLAIHGFLKLQGDFEGRPRPFVIMNCSPLSDMQQVFTVASSGMVVIKKLDRIAEKYGFPVAGKIIKEKNYFDLVD